VMNQQSCCCGLALVIDFRHYAPSLTSKQTSTFAKIATNCLFFDKLLIIYGLSNSISLWRPISWKCQESERSHIDSPQWRPCILVLMIRRFWVTNDKIARTQYQ
jgi:hypothetical protein